jgi:NinB protein
VTQEIYEADGVIDQGKLRLSGRQGFDAAISRFPDGHVVVTVKVARRKRSSAQNRFFHGVVIPLFAEHCGYELTEMKDALALELLPKEVVDVKTGEVRIVPGHTSELTTTQFNDLIERVQRLGAEMGIIIPDPDSEVAA